MAKSKDEVAGEIFFSNLNNSMQINCFDEDSEMYITIRRGNNSANYSMTVWEVKQLKKFIADNLKNNK